MSSEYGARNKRMGSDAERYYAIKFREMGYTHCKTSRLGSKLHDDAGIDLLFLPFNVQIKAGKQVGLNASKELLLIETKMKELFPPESVEHNLPKILIHKKRVGNGKKRTVYDEIISMTFEDFTKLIQK
jgi:hypothetical protein